MSGILGSPGNQASHGSQNRWARGLEQRALLLHHRSKNSESAFPSVGPQPQPKKVFAASSRVPGFDPMISGSLARFPSRTLCQLLHMLPLTEVGLLWADRALLGCCSGLEG